tara:strand:+ start:307 stop:648 length:342 start_codon:yes stop_codon:yes gene_type:complete
MIYDDPDHLAVFPPASYADDPVTSHEAEAVHTATGVRQTHAGKLLEIVRVRPGLITSELGEVSELGHMETRKRLSDLKNMNLIYQGQARMWQGSGRKQSSWWPVVEAQQMGMF